MGTTYYVDPAHGGTDSGSQANPWTSLQTALDTVAAGDTIFATGTETITAAIDVDTTSGTNNTIIKVVGCASDWSVDGTRFVINGNDNTLNGLVFAATNSSYYHIVNVEVHNCDGEGILINNGCIVNTYINCLSHTNTGNGFSGATRTADYQTLIRCAAYGNTLDGFVGFDNIIKMIFCVSYDNTGNGFGDSDNADYIGCVAHDNGSTGDAGFWYNGFGNVMFNCVANSEITGIVVSDNYSVIIGSRITNCTTGIDFNNNNTLVGWSCFHNNTSADFLDPATLGGYEDAGYAHAIPHDADADTNEIDQDADDGYNATGSDDLNLKADRTYNGDGTEVILMNIGS